MQNAGVAGAGKKPRQEVHCRDGHSGAEKHAGRHALRATFTEGEGEPGHDNRNQGQPRAMVFVNACCRTLMAFSQRDWPLTCANAADARSETGFFRKAFFIAGEFLSDDASRAPHRDSKAMGQPGGGSPQLQLSAPYAHRPAQPSPARGCLNHTSTPNRRWQNRESCQKVLISPGVIFRHCWSARNLTKVAL